MIRAMNLRFAIMCNLITLATLGAPGNVSAENPGALGSGVTVPLWDGPAPNIPDAVIEETTGADERVRNVSVPALIAYLPDKSVATGTAIIECSGGGYQQLAIKRHGGGAAAAFLPRGIAVFVLKYRINP